MPENEMQKPLNNLRNQVLDYLSSNGPSVPVEIAQGVKRESYFVGAILSELLQSKQVMLSHVKKGGSRVYYLPNQEEKLSMLYDYLPDAEKRAYDLLKENKVIKASESEPVERVALENLKDFAKQNIVGGDITWRWYLFNEESKPAIQEFVAPKEQPKINLPEKQTQILEPSVRIPIKENIVKSKDDTFTSKIESYFVQKNIQILNKEVIRKNSEANFMIKVHSQIGPIEMFVCAKNKKKINDQDIMLAHQKGQNKKMPTLFITTGEQSKKARDYLEKNLKGYMVFRRI